MSDWLIHDEETLRAAKKELRAMMRSARSENERPVFPAGGSSVGQKNLSVGQIGRSEIMARALEERCTHGSYRFGVGRSSDGGRVLLCAVCGEQVR